MKEEKVYLSDIIIRICECLKEVDNVNLEWRILYKYASDFLNDNKLKCEIKKLIKEND